MQGSGGDSKRTAAVSNVLQKCLGDRAFGAELDGLTMVSRSVPALVGINCSVLLQGTPTENSALSRSRENNTQDGGC